MAQEDVVWNELISWLQSKGMNEQLLVHSKNVPGAGRGLFTIKDVPPNTPLFTVPERAHINSKTLAPLYGAVGNSLTATQLISMHLFLHRPSHGAKHPCTDSSFGPYISILPRDFSGHPLLWMIDPQAGPQDNRFLISCLPSAAKSALKAMSDLFWLDWNAVTQILSAHPMIASSTRRPGLSLRPFTPGEEVQSYLWAWLNVNTRCVYHRIGASASDPDNLTLCPLLDLANHTSIPAYTPQNGPIPTFFSPSSRVLKQGEEVFLRYGPHSNVTLFTEYGFVERESRNGQVDVQDILVSFFQELGDKGVWMRTILEDTNYWGDWTLHDSPTPAHPSYRLLPALRLMHLSFHVSPSLSSKGVATETHKLDSWYETLRGEADIVSPENERKVWETMLEICRVAATRAKEGLDRLDQETRAHELRGWQEYAIEAITSLWLEEERVALAVMRSIMDGEAID